MYCVLGGPLLIKTHVHQFGEFLCGIPLMLSFVFSVLSESCELKTVYLLTFHVSLFVSVLLNFDFIFNFQKIFMYSILLPLVDRIL